VRFSKKEQDSLSLKVEDESLKYPGDGPKINNELLGAMKIGLIAICQIHNSSKN